jgi:hypothetical protein
MNSSKYITENLKYCGHQTTKNKDHNSSISGCLADFQLAASLLTGNSQERRSTLQILCADIYFVLQLGGQIKGHGSQAMSCTSLEHCMGTCPGRVQRSAINKQPELFAAYQQDSHITSLAYACCFQVVASCTPPLRCVAPIRLKNSSHLLVHSHNPKGKQTVQIPPGQSDEYSMSTQGCPLFAPLLQMYGGL